MKKVLLNAVAVCVGLAVGVAAGDVLFTVGLFNRPGPERYFTLTGIGWTASENALNRNAKDAKDLLLKNLKICEAGTGPDSHLDRSMKKALLLQAALTRARLSVVENGSGNSDQARLYMSAAQTDFRNLGWTDYSESHILRVLRQPTWPPE
ncbi:MAG: hypothetical protein LAP21_14110 [Acidobacteriia bacterium]|nr:hypothetical protein [Terriglobia bacterium]